jgi:hypothetical protein
MLAALSNYVFTVMDNYKNVPKFLYGLTHEQMNMFMAEDNILTNQADQVTPVSNSNIVWTLHLHSITIATKRKYRSLLLICSSYH